MWQLILALAGSLTLYAVAVRTIAKAAAPIYAYIGAAGGILMTAFALPALWPESVLGLPLFLVLGFIYGFVPALCVGAAIDLWRHARTGTSRFGHAAARFIWLLISGASPFLLVVIVGTVLAVLVWRAANGPPFLMTIQPADDGAVVQFIQRESREGGTLVSPEFSVPVQVDRGHTVELTSRTMKLPAGVIETADVTLKPGFFRIRFGDTTIDVLEAWLVVNGVDHVWELKE